jgi:hypothetical protein
LTGVIRSDPPSAKKQPLANDSGTCDCRLLLWKWVGTRRSWLNLLTRWRVQALAAEASDLANVSRACKLMGCSRRQLYEIRWNFQTPAFAAGSTGPSHCRLAARAPRTACQPGLGPDRGGRQHSRSPLRPGRADICGRLHSTPSAATSTRSLPMCKPSI